MNDENKDGMGESMPLKKIEIDQNQIINISQRIHLLLNKRISQGSLEYILFRAISDEINIDLFKEMPDNVWAE